MLKIAFRPEYKYALPPGHRFPMSKYELLPEQLLHEGTITEDNFFSPEKLSDEEVLRTHTDEYYGKLKGQSLSYKEARRIGFPMTVELVERGLHIAYGTYQCALFAKEHGVAMNIAGGTHHAFPGHGEGFCVFNDMAIAAHLLLDRQQAEKILIVDLDVHQGNGTAHIFNDERCVFTFSMHGGKNYPLRKEQSDLDIPLPDGTKGPEYLKILRTTLPSLIDSVEPDLMFYLSGVDVLESDKLGRLGLSRQECKERDEFVLKNARQNNIPVAVAMGGGYSPRISDIIEAHANTFRVAQELFF